MREIYLNKVTGFKVNDVNKPVIIRDSRGIIFYNTEPLVPRTKFFNLPSGIKLFVESGSFSPLNEPVKYRLPKIDRPQRKLKDPKTFKVLFKPNPNKCTISWNDETITFDPSLEEKSMPDLFYILYHEFGHQFFGTKSSDKGKRMYSEKQADRFAARWMLRNGFNPYQVLKSPAYTLSIRQDERVNDLINDYIDNQ